MSGKKKEEWMAHNELLQQAFRNYVSRTKHEKEKAACAIQQELEWGPFLNFVIEHGGFDPNGIIKYGIDSQTLKCIGDIDRIARGEIDYDY
ncbi:MAG: hypothetical protein IJ624_03020 [Prevotella sp.]|nr:hypothetical protein [Prevotella sp.]